MKPATKNDSSRLPFLKQPKLVLWLTGVSFIVFLYFFTGYIVLRDVYKYAAAGAIYEILWLPMFASIVVIPILSIAVLIKGNSKKWLALVPLVLMVTVVLILANV
jgi:hypothetical protein